MYECETCPRGFRSDRARARHMDADSHWAPRFECGFCDDWFFDEDDYYEHLDDYGHWPPQHECEACDMCFDTPQLARRHMDQYGHWRIHWCAVCQKGFQNDNNLRMHKRGAAHLAHFPYMCEGCDKRYATFDLARQHMDRKNHWKTHWCPCCQLGFENADNLQIHKRGAVHLAHFPYKCQGCNTRYTTLARVRQHMDNENHWREYWCQPCKRGFQNANNFKQHLHGVAHCKDSIRCPLCNRGFTTASGLAHHLETASCRRARNLNRESIYKAISARDIRGNISFDVLVWDSEFTATGESWNGHAYECYLCHRKFKGLTSLNQHLTSPVHKQILYRCFGIGCGKQFATLAALFGHLESESCGATRFESVQRSVHILYA